MSKKNVIIGLSINDSDLEEFEFPLDKNVFNELVAEYHRMAQAEDFDGKKFYECLKLSRPDLAKLVEEAVLEELKWHCIYASDGDNVDRFPLAYLDYGPCLTGDRNVYEIYNHNRYKFDFEDFEEYSD